MAKIVDEPVLLRYDTIDGKQVPVYSAKVETTVTTLRQGRSITHTRNVRQILTILKQTQKKKTSEEMST